ncbi:PAS domain-containing protein [Magnetovibrio blakemorei]|uniref:PAS fold-4 domain-containing protein n=1 Tax=Magnetovibrio blakemorei TaxID=28181 RepID=A0A1E5Q528_9PROT|nr:hypothetical protein [Magnetovibrio blakemorei]OEJ65190.1 hypothetical protein BEN30_15060 [Magnetovibrio blakemorei]
MPNKKIKKFYDLVNKDIQDGVIDYTTLQGDSYREFWTNFSIIEMEIKKLKFTYFGSTLTNIYGRDLTGTYFSKEEFGGQYTDFRETLKLVIFKKEITITKGTLHWKKRSDTQWFKVNVPLCRNGKIGSLALICFS